VDLKSSELEKYSIQVNHLSVSVLFGLFFADLLDGHSFATSSIFPPQFLRHFWIQTQRAAVARRCATNLATHIPSIQPPVSQPTTEPPYTGALYWPAKIDDISLWPPGSHPSLLYSRVYLEDESDACWSQGRSCQNRILRNKASTSSTPAPQQDPHSFSSSSFPNKKNTRVFSQLQPF
jgi:hypothetical protein